MELHRPLCTLNSDSKRLDKVMDAFSRSQARSREKYCCFCQAFILIRMESFRIDSVLNDLHRLTRVCFFRQIRESRAIRNHSRGTVPEEKHQRLRKEIEPVVFLAEARYVGAAKRYDIRNTEGDFHEVGKETARYREEC